MANKSGYPTKSEQLDRMLEAVWRIEAPFVASALHEQFADRRNALSAEIKKLLFDPPDGVGLIFIAAVNTVKHPHVYYISYTTNEEFRLRHLQAGVPCDNDLGALARWEVPWRKKYCRAIITKMKERSIIFPNPKSPHWFRHEQPQRLISMINGWLPQIREAIVQREAAKRAHHEVAPASLRGFANVMVLTARTRAKDQAKNRFVGDPSAPVQHNPSINPHTTPVI